MFLGGRASTWFTNKPNNKVRPSLYPDKITSVPHGFYTNSGKKKQKQKLTKQNKKKNPNRKNKTKTKYIYPFGSMFSVTEMKFKLQQ